MVFFRVYLLMTGSSGNWGGPGTLEWRFLGKGGEDLEHVGRVETWRRTSDGRTTHTSVPLPGTRFS